MIAGVTRGPSLLGAVLPEVHAGLLRATAQPTQEGLDVAESGPTGLKTGSARATLMTRTKSALPSTVHELPWHRGALVLLQ